MPDFGSLRPWEMGGFTYAEIEALRKGVRRWESEMKKHG